MVKVPKLGDDEAQKRLAELNDEWGINDKGRLVREFKFKGYAKAVYAANGVAMLCDQYNHHADVGFGWGYCKISLTTHDVKGLSELDFELAKAIELLISGVNYTQR